MSLQSIVPSLWRSFYSQRFYQDVCHQWKVSKALIYLSLLAVIHLIALWFGTNHLWHWHLEKSIVEATFNFFESIFICLFYAYVVMLWGAIFKLHLSYRQSYRLAIVSITPVYFLHILTANTHLLPEQIVWATGLVLQLTYLFIAAFANRPITQEEALPA